MSNFDLANFALKAVCPSNELIYDDKNIPGVYVKRASQKLNALLNTSNTSIHPAFKINNVEKSALYFGKYQGKVQDNRMYSFPGADPQVYIDLDTFIARCRAKGAGHHCITAAEWAFLALLCKKNGTQPRGNNNYGKDHNESAYVAIPTYIYDSGATIGRVATGTGPVTWSDTGDRDGIFDLNGNVWEWIAGIRLVYGELQVIPYNNAAMDNIDMSATSSEWKAINVAATGWDDLFITPDGSGTTTNSVKLNWVSGHWRWQAAAITKTAQNGIFANIDFDGVSDFAKLYLRAMALAPDEGATAADYNGDNVWANTNEAERCALRGGDWAFGALDGVFALAFYNPRSHSYGNVGGRPAFDN